MTWCDVLCGVHASTRQSMSLHSKCDVMTCGCDVMSVHSAVMMSTGGSVLGVVVVCDVMSVCMDGVSSWMMRVMSCNVMTCACDNSVGMT